MKKIVITVTVLLILSDAARIHKKLGAKKFAGRAPNNPLSAAIACQ